MSIPKNPAMEIARKQKRLLYWRECLNAEKTPGNYNEITALLASYSRLLYDLGLEPTEDKWEQASDIEAELNLAFNSSRLETRRADVLPEAK